MGYSSNAGFADSEIVVSSRGELIQRIVASHLAETVYSQEGLLKLTNTLIHFAEQAYALRDMDTLQEVSSVLMNLPIASSRQIGFYYHALAINRTGQKDEAAALLETVAGNAPITYRARAIQTLGANHFDEGLPEDALRFQLDALRVASDKKAHGLQTILLANLEISYIKSETGDHKGALSVLEGISPLVQIVSRQNPLYFYFYHNELAVEFGELNRIAEAKAASAIALSSPFAPAYPEWAETRRELEAKRTSATRSTVAINRAPEAEQSAQLERQPKPESPRRLAFTWLAGDKQPFQTSATPLPATARATIALNTISILDRVLICAGSRAPPLLF